MRTKHLGFLTAALEEGSPPAAQHCQGVLCMCLVGHRHDWPVPFPLPGADHLISGSFRANSSKISASQAPSHNLLPLADNLPEPEPQPPKSARKRRPPSPNSHDTYGTARAPQTQTPTPQALPWGRAVLPLVTSPPQSRGEGSLSAAQFVTFGLLIPSLSCSQKTSFICTH